MSFGKAKREIKFKISYSKKLSDHILNTYQPLRSERWHHLESGEGSKNMGMEAKEEGQWVETICCTDSNEFESKSPPVLA